ncbi:MAG: winged helix-turn-helix domain-containing protein [Streptomyces sp.]|nr:winged helix-turn-helix domain-containing protein [Streptomyces sp.]NUP36191.1 winged helix-turn-helix domain-containing protein [Streptomyces sp.]NUS75538.1 winged helix-turn-helix domain-containing protein [Streptomyces sp.]
MTTGNEPPVPDEPQPSPGKPRDSRGNFTGTIDTDTRAANAARLKADNPRMTYRELAKAVGYSNPGDAWRAVDKCRKAVLQAAGAELIASEAALLDDQFVSAMEILERDHVVVSHGKVITGADGEPLLDDGPKLAALREMRAIRESYRKLLGVDQPTQVAVSGAVRYEVVGVDPADLT